MDTKREPCKRLVLNHQSDFPIVMATANSSKIFFKSKSSKFSGIEFHQKYQK